MKIRGTIKDSFIKENPIICTFPEFAAIYDKYNEEEADKIMWAIYLMEYPDPEENSYAEVPRQERLEDIKSGFYKLDIEEHAQAMRVFSQRCLSFEEQMFAIQKLKMDEAMMVYRDLDLDNDKDFDKYMKMGDKMQKHWDNYKDARSKLLAAKESNSQIFGDKELSVSEQRRQRKNA